MRSLHEFPAVCFNPEEFFLPGMDRHTYADPTEIERLIADAEEVEPCVAP